MASHIEPPVPAAAARDAGCQWPGEKKPLRTAQPPQLPRRVGYPVPGNAAAGASGRARNPRWEPGMGMIPDPRQIGDGDGDGDSESTPPPGMDAQARPLGVASRAAELGGGLWRAVVGKTGRLSVEWGTTVEHTVWGACAEHARLQLNDNDD